MNKINMTCGCGKEIYWSSQHNGMIGGMAKYIPGYRPSPLGKLLGFKPYDAYLEVVCLGCFCRFDVPFAPLEAK